MKRNLCTGTLVLFFLAIFGLGASSARADYLKLTGPSGTQVNGYYTNGVTFTGEGDHFYTASGGSSCGSVEHSTTVSTLSASGNLPGDKWYSYFEGTHTYKIIGDQYSNGWYQKENETPVNIFSLYGCPIGYSYENAKILWSGELKIDERAPSLTLESPSNNQNINTETITVRGKASDLASGVNKVEVNGKNAALSGESYSSDIKLVSGLNTILVTATDNVGRKTSTQILVFRLENLSDNSQTTQQNNAVKQTGKALEVTNSSDSLEPEYNKVLATKNTDGTIVFYGKTDPNTDLTLKIHSSDPIVKAVKSNSLGLWSFILDQNLEQGDHEAYIEYDKAGQKITTEKLTFVIKTEAAAANQTQGKSDMNDNSFYYILYGGILIAILAIALSVMVYRRKRK